MQEPDVAGIVDIKAVSDLQYCEDVGPGGAYLCSHICPQTFNSHVMDTPVVVLVLWDMFNNF